MSDVRSRSRHAKHGGFPVNRDTLIKACAAKGAVTADERANLLGITQKMAYNYEYGHIAPNLARAQQIAETLGLEVKEIWPGPAPERKRRAA